jgi:hypothetical protein
MKPADTPTKSDNGFRPVVTRLLGVTACIIGAIMAGIENWPIVAILIVIAAGIIFREKHGFSHISFCDGTIRKIPQQVAASRLKAIFTANGGEQVDFTDWQAAPLRGKLLSRH